MVDKRIKELDGIETVGALREALLDLSEDMAITDGVGELILLTVYEDRDTGLQYVEIG